MNKQKRKKTDEISLEQSEEALEGEETDTEPNPELQALAEQLAQAETQREEYLNLAQRVQADFENFRRRNQSVRAEAVEDGAREVLTQLLPVLDNLERAVEAAKDDTTPLKEGVEMVLRQLRDTMGKFGIEEICRLGQPFDPEIEHAVLRGAEGEGEPGTICEVLQKGYKAGQRVLRPAMVKVVAGD